MSLDAKAICAELIALREKIKAPLIDYEHVKLPKLNMPIELNSENKLDVVSNILAEHSSNLIVDKYLGLFLLYIPFIVTFKGKASLPRYHFIACSTVRQKEKAGELARFRLTSDTSGNFMMSDGKTHRLRVCRNCLREYRGPKMWLGEADFSLDKLVQCADRIMPEKYIDLVRMGVILPNEYPEYWKSVSRAVREAHHWVCSECGVNLHDAPGLLHVHHRNHIKTDITPANLQVLCKLCHANFHPFMQVNITESEREFILNRRKEMTEKFQRS